MEDTTISFLKSRYGSHGKVAEALGIGRRQYENWRKGNINSHGKRTIELLVKSLAVGGPAPEPPDQQAAGS